jgi:chromosome segregation ATPase
VLLTEILAHVEASLKDAQTAIGPASAPSVLSIITLDMDIAHAGTVGTKSRQQFEFFLISDLAEASGLVRANFEVKLVEAGSVVVHVEIRGEVANGKTSHHVAESLRLQANDPRSLLRAGQVTRKIKSFDIKAGHLALPATMDDRQQRHKEQPEERKQQLSSWVENLKQALIMAMKSHAEAQAEIEALATKLGDSETETHALREQVGSMNAQLAAQDASEQINQLHAQLEREREETDKMREKLKNLKELESDQIKRAQVEVNELKARLLEARQDIQKGGEEIGRLKDMVSRLEALQREHVLKSEEELLKSKAKALEHKEDLKSLDLRRKEEVAILESEKTRLGEVLAAGARRCADLEKDVTRLEARIHDQVIVLADKQKELGDLSKSFSASTAEREMLQKRCREIQDICQQQLSDLRQRVNTNCASFEADVRQLQQSEAELRQQVVDHQSVLSEGKHTDFPSPTCLQLQSRLDVLRYQLHEEEERREREVLPCIWIVGFVSVGFVVPNLCIHCTIQVILTICLRTGC